MDSIEISIKVGDRGCDEDGRVSWDSLVTKTGLVSGTGKEAETEAIRVVEKLFVQIAKDNELIKAMKAANA